MSEYSDLASTIIGVTNLHSPGTEDIIFGPGIPQEMPNPRLRAAINFAPPLPSPHPDQALHHIPHY